MNERTPTRVLTTIRDALRRLAHHAPATGGHVTPRDHGDEVLIVLGDDTVHCPRPGCDWVWTTRDPVAARIAARRHHRIDHARAAGIPVREVP